MRTEEEGTKAPALPAGRRRHEGTPAAGHDSPFSSLLSPLSAQPPRMYVTRKAERLAETFEKLRGLLGVLPDGVVARFAGCGRARVILERKRRGIAAVKRVQFAR